MAQIPRIYPSPSIDRALEVTDRAEACMTTAYDRMVVSDLVLQMSDRLHAESRERTARSRAILAARERRLKLQG